MDKETSLPFWKTCDPNFLNIDYLKNEIINIEKQIVETDERIKIAQEYIDSPNKKRFITEGDSIDDLKFFKEQLYQQIDFTTNHIKHLERIIAEFTEDTENTIDAYKVEFGCSQEDVLELLYIIPQLNSIYSLLKEKL
ncbi:hypothetical protein [uncultured Microscilla sp.]|uniref:hypothetical protein n=1 Tax=uncultured Microscilla sp. TaxID=432653 RepID=UPI0026230C8E|nr:hypothetical protein [uncultured Microscilla sp.]